MPPLPAHASAASLLAYSTGRAGPAAFAAASPISPRDAAVFRHGSPPGGRGGLQFGGYEGAGIDAPPEWEAAVQAAMGVDPAGLAAVRSVMRRLEEGEMTAKQKLRAKQPPARFGEPPPPGAEAGVGMA